MPVVASRRIIVTSCALIMGAVLGAGEPIATALHGARIRQDTVRQGTPPRDSAGARRATLDAVAHPEHIQLGLPVTRPYVVLVNPYERDPRAVDEGKKLFTAYNCIDCHGADGSGGMGPSLADGRWHFGGRAGEVFQSIYEGRPDGMPAWGARIGDDQIWKLVAYVRSLDAGTASRDVATENFQGGTVERSGH